MSGKQGKPGSGRYTNYIPVDVGSGTVDRWKKRKALFNDKAGDAGAIYTGDTITAVSEKLVADASTAYAQIDLGMFPDGVTKDFSGAPNKADVEWKNAGDPANAYAPDITSPGPGKTEGKQKDSNPDLSAEDFGRPSAGTTDNTRSPSATSTGDTGIGKLPIGQVLEMGKSGVVKT